jgi:hypothetical protein
MNDFDEMVKRAKERHIELMAMTPVKKASLEKWIYPGVYLFTEEGIHLYAGRSRRPLKKRIQEHSRPSKADAPFAWRLAREATGKTTPAYTESDEARKALAKDPEFAAELLKQKERIGRMDIRCVREDDPIVQTLLEIYTATVLETRYNDFKTT